MTASSLAAEPSLTAEELAIFNSLDSTLFGFINLGQPDQLHTTIVVQKVSKILTKSKFSENTICSFSEN